MVEVRVWPLPGFAPLHLLLEGIDCVRVARDLPETFGPKGEPLLKVGAGGVGAVVKAAAGSAGDVFVHLAEVNTAGDCGRV
jgi:hypothetical protein